MRVTHMKKRRNRNDDKIRTNLRPPIYYDLRRRGDAGEIDIVSVINPTNELGIMRASELPHPRSPAVR